MTMRWFIGLIAIIFLIVVGFMLFGGHKTPKPIVGPTIQPLPDYANTTATVQMTIDGEVNGDESHRAIRVTVGQSERNLDIIQGYSGHILENHNYYNTPDAYRVFLKSIARAGFLTKNKKSKVSTDPEGYCPLGLRYIFTLNSEGDQLSQLWSSSCGTSTGNMAGNVSTLKALFQNQIPDYSKVTQNVQLE